MLKVIKSMTVSLLVAPSVAQFDGKVMENSWGGKVDTLGVNTDPVLKPVFDTSWSSSIKKATPGTTATGISKATTSIEKASTTIFGKPPREAMCCKAMTPKCLACAQGISVEEFCASKKNKRYVQCQRGPRGGNKGKGKGSKRTGPKSQSAKNTTATGTGTPCISDEDCLQLAGARQCPLFCVEGRCAAWKEDYPPVLHLRSGIKVKTGGFVLRDEAELDKIFDNPTQWVPVEMLEGRFLERVEGSDELLEVKYPKGFFEMAARDLESAPGDVAASELTRHTADFEHQLSGGIDSDGPRIAVPDVNVNPGTVSRVDMRQRLDGRRLTAIQDQSPDRWHSGVMNTRFPWRMTGRLSMGCTAALIGNRVLVTAAHCVWDKDTNSWDAFPTFAAGQDGADQPFGTARVNRMTIPSCYQTCSSNECRGCDWAVLVLRNSDRLNVGYFGFSTNKAGLLNIAGYPQSKNREQWYDNCPLFSDEGKWIKHRCDTEPGNSGSGIYTIRNGNRYIVSIHGGGYTDLWNRGADIAGRTSSAGRVYDRMLSERRIYG